MSSLPFRRGDEIIKYRLEPATPPEDVPDDATDYLATDLVNRLAKREYRFTLSVQFRTDPDAMPLDQATVDWPEDRSPYIPVATLVLPRQDVEADGQEGAYGQKACPSTSGAYLPPTAHARNRRSPWHAVRSMPQAPTCVVA